MPTPVMMEAIGTILQNIPATTEDTAIVESYITQLIPSPSFDSSSSSSSSPPSSTPQDPYPGSISNHFSRDAFMYPPPYY